MSTFILVSAATGLLQPECMITREGDADQRAAFASPQRWVRQEILDVRRLVDPEFDAEIVQALLHQLGDPWPAHSEDVRNFALGQSFQEIENQRHSLALGEARERGRD